jgi:hypothetical protein
VFLVEIYVPVKFIYYHNNQSNEKLKDTKEIIRRKPLGTLASSTNKTDRHDIHVTEL